MPRFHQPPDKGFKRKPMQLRPAEEEVLANVHHYEVRKFLGRGVYQSVCTLGADLRVARSLRDEMAPQAMIYAVGTIPSRNNEPGVCFIE